MTLGDWGVASPGELPADLVQPFSLVDQFEDFGTGGAPTQRLEGQCECARRTGW